MKLELYKNKSSEDLKLQNLELEECFQVLLTKKAAMHFRMKELQNMLEMSHLLQLNSSSQSELP